MKDNILQAMEFLIVCWNFSCKKFFNTQTAKSLRELFWKKTLLRLTFDKPEGKPAKFVELWGKVCVQCLNPHSDGKDPLSQVL